MGACGVFCLFFSCFFFVVVDFLCVFSWFFGSFGDFFWYIFNLFSVDSIFLELLKVCRPLIAFYTCQHKNAKSRALACLSDMMPMVLEGGLG